MASKDFQTNSLKVYLTSFGFNVPIQLVVPASIAEWSMVLPIIGSCLSLEPKFESSLRHNSSFFLDMNTISAKNNRFAHLYITETNCKREKVVSDYEYLVQFIFSIKIRW